MIIEEKSLENKSNLEKKKIRNYSFLEKNEESFDAIEDGDKTFIIPSRPGSCYWAILKIGYQNHDTPIPEDKYIDMVSKLLEDFDPDNFDKFKNKSRIKTIKNKIQIEKNTNSWRERIKTNIRTLTRHSGNNCYGKRLIERGHILRWEPDHFGGIGAFVLRTDTNEPLIKRNKSSKE